MKGSGSADNHRNSGSPCKRPRTQRRSCHHVEPTVIISSHLISSHPSLQYMFFVRRTNTTLDVLLESRTDDNWKVFRWLGTVRAMDWFHAVHKIERKNIQTETDGPLGVPADKNSSNIKARPQARNLVRNVYSISTKRKNIIGRLKNRRSTMLGS